MRKTLSAISRRPDFVSILSLDSRARTAFDGPVFVAAGRGVGSGRAAWDRRMATPTGGLCGRCFRRLNARRAPDRSPVGRAERGRSLFCAIC